jgi:hypothetical protein
VDLASVRRALRAHLEERGYEVASDSHGLRNDVYIMGAGDLARALSEFMPSAEEACDAMYQGSWIAGMPPRFAVMPASESGSPALEMLEQILVIPVFSHRWIPRSASSPSRAFLSGPATLLPRARWSRRLQPFYPRSGLCSRAA